MYFKEICARAFKETKKIWTPQRTLIAFASPVVTVPIRGAISAGWNMHDVFTTAWVTLLVVGCGWGIIFLYEFVRAPSLLHKSQQDAIAEHVRTIDHLKSSMASQTPPTREQIVRDKVMDSLKGLTLDGIRVVKHIHASHLEYEQNLVEKFGSFALVDAEGSMLLEKRETQSSNTELFCYLIREEYKAILDDVLPTVTN